MKNLGRKTCKIECCKKELRKGGSIYCTRCGEYIRSYMHQKRFIGVKIGDIENEVSMEITKRENIVKERVLNGRLPKYIKINSGG